MSAVRGRRSANGWAAERAVQKSAVAKNPAAMRGEWVWDCARLQPAATRAQVIRSLAALALALATE
jgi:hypothetical protein